MIFDIDTIQKLYARAIDEELHLKRDFLLAGVDPAYVATLDGRQNDSDQLYADLVKMNNDDAVGSRVPLVRWLRNAAFAITSRKDAKQYFSERADQAEIAVLPPAISGVYEPIKQLFNAEQLKKVLRERTNLDTSDFGIFSTKNKDASALSLLLEVRQRGPEVTAELLKALRQAQPDNPTFAAAVDAALRLLVELPREKVKGKDLDKPLLPPCVGCWWRATRSSELEATALCFTNHLGSVRTDRGLADLPADLPRRLSRETQTLDHGANIVETANAILRTVFASATDGKLIAADFEARHIDSAWADVLVDAEQRGPATLVVLFLAIFLQGGELSSLADHSLRTLLNLTENSDA